MPHLGYQELVNAKYLVEGEPPMGEALTVVQLAQMKHKDRRVAHGPMHGCLVREAHGAVIEAMQQAFARAVGRALSQDVPVEWASMLDEVAPPVRIDPLMWLSTGAFYKSGVLLPEAKRSLDKAQKVVEDIEELKRASGDQVCARAMGEVVEAVRRRLQPQGYSQAIARLKENTHARDVAAEALQTPPVQNACREVLTESTPPPEEHPAAFTYGFGAEPQHVEVTQSSQALLRAILCCPGVDDAMSLVSRRDVVYL